MTNKFKVGDSVQISDLCCDIKEHPWFHRATMKIIGVNEFYYFTDYWHSHYDLSRLDEIHDGITEECLDFSIVHKRKLKLEKLREI